MPADNHHKNYEVFNAVWRGIELEIRHMRNWAAGFDHIEVISAERAPLPITETGYKSHFIQNERIAEYGTSFDYALAWLDDAAQSESWKLKEAQEKQLRLF